VLAGRRVLVRIPMRHRLKSGQKRKFSHAKCLPGSGRSRRPRHV